MNWNDTKLWKRTEVPASERANLFVRKLRLCAVICDFSEGAGNDRDKEIKRQARTFHFNGTKGYSSQPLRYIADAIGPCRLR